MACKSARGREVLLDGAARTVGSFWKHAAQVQVQHVIIERVAWDAAQVEGTRACRACHCARPCASHQPLPINQVTFCLTKPNLMPPPRTCRTPIFTALWTLWYLPLV